MTPDDEDDLRESPLTPADDERIRRLLAEARHTEPLPPTVAGRLDEALADLVAERRDREPAPAAPRHHKAPVVDLAARRRRTAANLLVAAAAVIAVGIGISQVLPDGLGGGADMATTQDEGSGEDALAPADGGAEGELPPEAPTDGQRVVIRAERFGADVRKARDRVDAGQYAVDEDAARVQAQQQGCLPVDVGAGLVLPAVYDGANAVLVLRRASGEVQVVDLYLCGDTEPRRSITLTAP